MAEEDEDVTSPLQNPVVTEIATTDSTAPPLNHGQLQGLVEDIHSVWDGVTSDGLVVNDNNPPVNSDQIFLNTNTGQIQWSNFGTMVCTKPPKLGDISYIEVKEAVCIYDGEGWKPLLLMKDLQKMFEEFKEECLKDKNKWVRFLELELEDEDDEIPQNFKDEALIQMFRLKLQKAIGKIRFDK